RCQVNSQVADTVPSSRMAKQGGKRHSPNKRCDALCFGKPVKVSETSGRATDFEYRIMRRRTTCRSCSRVEFEERLKPSPTPQIQVVPRNSGKRVPARRVPERGTSQTLWWVAVLCPRVKKCQGIPLPAFALAL